MTRLLSAILLLASTAAHADMIDYGFSFTSQAVAQANAQMLAGQYSVASGWLLDHVFIVQCWRPSQDVTVANPVPPPDTITQHTYLTGFYLFVSADTDSPIPALLNHANLRFALNRTAREAGQPFVIKNNIGAILTDLGCQPLPQMSNPYPIGGFN